MKIAHIIPTSYLDIIDSKFTPDFYMVLAHQVISDASYANFFAEKSKEGKHVLLDNSAFEFGGAVDDSVLLQAIDLVSPTEFILPDVLFDGNETLNRTLYFLDKHARKDVRYMAVPQGKTIDQWLESYKNLSKIPNISSIGIGAIYAKHDVFGVDRSYISGREYILDELKATRLLDTTKEHHLLGLGNSGHLEIEKLKKNDFIRSTDSSAAFIHGMQGKKFEKNEAYQKLKEKINLDQPFAEDNIDIIYHNMEILNESAR